MKTKTLLASVAVASLAIAQPAAAATRSADSLPQNGARSVGSVERIGAPTGESDELRGKPILVIFLVFAVLAGIILAVSGGKSPG